jgi:hypothetical protein
MRGYWHSKTENARPLKWSNNPSENLWGVMLLCEARREARLRPASPYLRRAFLRQPATYLSAILPQEAVQIFVFPASCSVVAVKFTFSAVEFWGVNSSSAIFVNFLRNHGV